MKYDPFQGLDQRLFTSPDKSTSRQATKSASLPAALPASHAPAQPSSQATVQPVVQPAEQQHARSTRNTRRRADTTGESRVVERHTYDIYEDQARWMNRLKLEMDEQHRAELTSNGIVQLALDVLRDDFAQSGERSKLFVALVLNKPWQTAPLAGGQEGA